MLAPGATPRAGDSIELVTGSSIAGSFARAVLPALDAGLAWRLATTPTRVTLIAEARMAGDFNADGQVNAADYTVWRDTLGGTGVLLAADADANGAVGASDHTLWRRDYARAAQPLPIPEQAIATLCAVGVVATGAASAVRRGNRRK